MPKKKQQKPDHDHRRWWQKCLNTNYRRRKNDNKASFSFYFIFRYAINLTPCDSITEKQQEAQARYVILLLKSQTDDAIVVLRWWAFNAVECRVDKSKKFIK